MFWRINRLVLFLLLVLFTLLLVVDYFIINYNTKLEDALMAKCIYSPKIAISKTSSDLDANITRDAASWIKSTMNQMEVKGENNIITTLRYMDMWNVSHQTSITYDEAKSLQSRLHNIDTWQYVRDTSIYVFSAFFIENCVRIVAVNELTEKNEVYCHFWEVVDGQIKLASTIRSEMRVMPEHHYWKYTASLFVCSMKNGIQPKAVSLSKENNVLPSNIVKITYYEQVTTIGLGSESGISPVKGDSTLKSEHNNTKLNRPLQRRKNFIVCVKPIHSKYENVSQLVEMLEINQILGADHFYFYVYNITKEIRKILELYKAENKITVIDWNIPVTNITTYGQLAAQNDCLYRNTGSGNYIIFVDIDEYIIPRKDISWNKLMQRLPETNGSYIFLCTFFGKEWPNIIEVLTEEDRERIMLYNITSLLKFKREDFIFPPLQRSKQILKPEFVDIVGIHEVHKFKNGGEYFYVDPEDALLNHYRLKSFQLPRTPKNVGRVNDFVMLQFKYELIDKIENRWNIINSQT